MANVYCYRDNCRYRSKKKSRAKNKRGEFLHRCIKDTIVISDFVDGDIIDFSNTNTCCCLCFELEKKAGDS
ncbi:MAG: hypothetical protein VR68_11845 [Peptococcaceae bacterium BRH_c4a]|nr:MAG: hypothetical protein VR68_11845 [Peptococcaceae bacterium BRH_c4a]